MLDLPSGNVTFLFTDIEGSTRLLQQLGDRYVIVLTECCYLLRSAFQRWNGREVDTQGDSFFVAFAHASDAVSAAVMAQRLLYTHTWPEGVAVRVRMGIHSGEPSLIPQGYIGLDVHRAARIMSAGHGGQVLLSRATYELSKNTLPADVKLRDAGEHLLKDLQHPEHLFQLVISDIPANFPPLRTLNSTTASSSAVSKHTTSTVYAIAWSPDRRYIASGGHDPTVRMWKSTTAVNVALYRGHTTGVFYIAWSPDGKHIASMSRDNIVQVWDAASGGNALTFHCHTGSVHALAWLPDGKHLAAVSGDGVVQVWRAA